MVPKKAEWNRAVPAGNGVCHSCHGEGKLRQIRSTHPCTSCERTGVCHMCDGKGVRFDGYNCEYCDSNFGISEKKFYEAVGKNASIYEVIEAISQEAMACSVGKKCDAARESSPPCQITVDSRSEYEDILGKYMTHYSERAMFHDHMNPDNPFLTAEYILEKTRGSARISYECARSGELGGMKGLLDSIHEFAKGILTERVLKSTLDYFHVPERVRLMEEYLAIHGATHLPRQFQGQSAIVLGDRYFSEVLTHHVLVVEPALRTEAERA